MLLEEEAALEDVCSGCDCQSEERGKEGDRESAFIDRLRRWAVLRFREVKFSRGVQVN